jgi:hypothetical protein
MSAAKHTPIAAELVAAPSQAFDRMNPDDRPRACQGCSGYHGSVNEGRLCLERHLRIARDLLERLRAGKGI